MKTIVIGLGNPILTDDSVGIKISQEISKALQSGLGCRNADVREVHAGGIRLMDALTGYDRAFIADAMVTGRFRPGHIHEFGPDELCATRNIQCSHDTNLMTALELGKMLGLHLPSEIRIWGIEASDTTTFGEELTDEVAGAIPSAVDKILGELGCSNKADRR